MGEADNMGGSRLLNKYRPHDQLDLGGTLSKAL